MIGFLAISGMSMSLAGVAVIGADQPGGLALGAGTSLILFAALCSALFIVLQRRLVADLSPFETASWFMIAGAACMLPFSGHALTAMVSAPPMAIGIIVFLAVCPGALGQVTWLHVVKAMPAGRASSLLFLVPPLATLLGAVTLGESITNALLVGGSLAILGVILVQRSGNAAAYDAAGADLPHTDSFSHNSRP